MKRTHVLQIFFKQECIPVGCVLPAAVAISPATHTPLCHACPPSPCMPPSPNMPPFTMHAPLTMNSPFTTHAPLCHTHPPSPCMTPLCHAHPPVNRITDACENINLPQTSFAGGIKRTLLYCISAGLEVLSVSETHRSTRCLLLYTWVHLSVFMI